MNQTWERTEWLIGQAALARLKKARVAVFGIGGVGSYAVEALARSGIGFFRLVDHDLIEASNVNRQVHANHHTLGQAKVEVMKERILSINPQAQVEAHKLFFTPEDPFGLLTADLDYVVDAIDSVPSKVGLIKRAKHLGLAIISCMGAGNKLDPTRFELADIADTAVCPLCRTIRRRLRQEDIHQLTVVYSREQPTLVDPQAVIGHTRAIGSIATVPASAGLVLASRVIEDLIRPASDSSPQ